MAMSETSRSIALQELLNGGIVNNIEMANKMAELVISHVYGPQELERQKPLKVIDQKDRWRIEGSYNADHSVEDVGPVEFVIAKRDAQIYELLLPQVMFVPPEAAKLLDERRSKKE